MEVVLLGLVLVAGIALIPFGLPGTWLMLLAALVYNWLTPTAPFGWVTIVGVAALAIVGEVIELVLSARYTKKYGGSRRAGWGAVLGGLVGAIVGVPIPILGSIVGAFAGAFVGAYVLEATAGTTHGAAARAAKGAVIGRAIAAAAKVAIGCVMAAWLVIAAMA